MFDSKNYHRTTQNMERRTQHKNAKLCYSTNREIKVVPRTKHLIETKYSILFPTLISMFFFPNSTLCCQKQPCPCQPL